MLTRRSWLRRLWVQLAHTLPKASARKGLRARKASQTQAEVLELRTLLTAPAVTSIELNGPTVTNSSSLSWTVVFDQAVSGVDATDSFADTVGLVSAAQIQVAGGGTAYQVTVSGIAGNGTVALNLVDDNSIVNSLNEPLQGSGNLLEGDFSGQVATVDSTPPWLVSILRETPATPSTNLSTVSFLAEFSEPVAGVDATDFLGSTTGTVTASRTTVTAVNPSLYRVTVSGIAGIGSVGLDLNHDGSVRDTAGNTLTAQNVAANFSDEIMVGTGALPTSVLSADVNGDGKADIVSVNVETDSVGILLGNGNGTFQPARTFPTGAGPWSVAIGDLNRDGKLDLVTANFYDDTVSVLLGLGNGSFQAPRTFATELGPFAVSLGDLNGDQKLDIVVVNSTFGGTVSVLLGIGDGTFAEQTPFAVGSIPESVAIGDLNGDRIPDLAVANEFDNTVSVLLGIGDGTFQDQQIVDTGSTPHSIVLSDLNDDGNLDIVVADSYDFSVGVNYGNGDGSFQYRVLISTDTNPFALALGDLNRDGRLDIATANFDDDSVSILLANSSGTFDEPRTFVAASGPRSITVADIDGDGNPDLIVGAFNANTIGVLKGNDSIFKEAYTITTTATLNDPPLLSSSNSSSYTENHPAIVINPSVNLLDVDDRFVSSATVKISANYTAGQDVLVFTGDPKTTGGIVGSFDPATGILTLTSLDLEESPDQFQAALRLVTYQNTSSTPNTQPRQIDFQVDDGELLSNILTNQMIVSAINSAPELTSPKVLSYREGQGATIINTQVGVSDSDSSTFGFAIVNITGNYLSLEDELAFKGNTWTGDITGSFNSTTGTLVLVSPSGTATASQFQAALRLVTYVNSSSTPSTLQRTVSYQISDGLLLSSALINTINITAVNTSPVLSGNTSVAAKELQAVPVNTRITISDLDSTMLTSATVVISSKYVIGQDRLEFVGNPSTTGDILGSFDSVTGTLTLSSAGATIAQFQAALRLVTYRNTSSNPSLSPRSVTYQVSDGNMLSNSIVSQVTIVPVNDAPVIGGVRNTTYTEGEPWKIINPSFVLSDADNTALLSVSVRITSNYVAEQDELSFVGNSSTGNIVGNFSSATGTLTLISPGGSATLAQFQAALRLVTYRNSSTAPSLSTRSLTFQASDREMLSTPVVSTISLMPVNNAPTLMGGSGVVHRVGETASVISSTIVVGDVDNATLRSATVRVAQNYVVGQDLLTFVPNPVTMGNITGSFNATTGTLTLTSVNSTATLSQFQAALRNVSYINSNSNTPVAPRTVEFQISDGSASSNIVSSLITIKGGGASPSILGFKSVTYQERLAPVVVNSALTISDVDSLTLASATVRIAANFSTRQDLLEFIGTSATGNIYGQYQSATGVLTLISPGATATVAQFQAALRLVRYSNTSSSPSTLPRSVTYQVSDGTSSSNIVTSTVQVVSLNQAPIVAGGNSLIVQAGQTAAVISPSLNITDVDSSTMSSATVRISANYVAGEDILGFIANPATTGNIVGSFDSTTATLTLTSANSTATVTQFQAALRLVTYLNQSSSPSNVVRSVSYQVNDGGLNSNNLLSVVSVVASNASPNLTGPSSITYFEKQAATVVNSAIVITSSSSATLASATVRISTNYSRSQDILNFVGNASTGNITGSFDPVSGSLTLISVNGTATVAQFQAALRLVTYSNSSVTPSLLPRTVSFQVSNGSLPGNILDSTVTITAVQDAPVISGSSGILVQERVEAAINSTIVVSGIDQTRLSSAKVSFSSGYSAGQDIFNFVRTSATGNILGSFDSTTGVLTLTSASSLATIAQFQAALRLVTYQNSSSSPKTGIRAVDFQVFDGSLGSNLVTSVISVTSVNDTPTVTGSKNLTYNENQVATIINNSINVSDLDNSTLAWASVAISENYSAGQDVLGFVGNSSTGNIFGSFNPASGTLLLISPGASATIAQFRAALRLVTYRNTSSAPSILTRSVAFRVSDGNAVSSPLMSSITVGSINNAPVLTGTTAVIVANPGSAVPINTTIVVSDADNATLSSATVRISANYVAGQDILGFVGSSRRTGNILGSFDSVTGILTLTSADSTATLAQFQAALRLVTYRNTSSTPSRLARSIEFTASDGTLSSSVARSLITIKSAGEPPVLQNTNTVAYSENQPPVQVNPGIIVSDADSARLASATVTISHHFLVEEDVLGFIGNSTTGNIVGSYNNLTGVLTLISSGASATLAQFQNALRLVTYSNVSDDATPVSRSITFQVSDGSNLSAISTSTVIVQ